MMIRIIPFMVDSIRNLRAPLVGNIDDLPITYWAIYLDDKQISYTSSEELAEKTKLWMEKWLKDKL